MVDLLSQVLVRSVSTILSSLLRCNTLPAVSASPMASADMSVHSAAKATRTSGRANVANAMGALDSNVYTSFAHPRERHSAGPWR